MVTVIERLQNFCKDFNIPATGNQKALTNRVLDFFEQKVILLNEQIQTLNPQKGLLANIAEAGSGLKTLEAATSILGKISLIPLAYDLVWGTANTAKIIYDHMNSDGKYHDRKGEYKNNIEYCKLIERFSRKDQEQDPECIQNLSWSTWGLSIIGIYPKTEFETKYNY